VVRGGGGLLVAVAVGWTVCGGVREPAAAAAFGAVIVLGEALRVPPGADREGAPLATAGALGYALVAPGGADVAQAVALTFVCAALAAAARTVLRRHAPTPARAVLRRHAPIRARTRLGGRAPTPARAGPLRAAPIPAARRPGPEAGKARGHGRHARGRRAPAAAGGSGQRAGRLVRGCVAVAFAAVCCQPLHDGGPRGAPLAAGYVAVLVLVGLCDAAVAAALGGAPFAAGLRDEVRGLAAMGSAVCAGGVVLALAVDSAGLWAVPVVAVPLLLTQLGLRGHAAVRATYRQTVTTLARATEVAGYTPEGHARRVGDLAAAVGRELGLPPRRVLLLEYAALMHDIGQLSLVDPVPRGATQPLDAGRRRTIAALGGEVARATGAPAEVALIVERQAHPYREQPLACRIVRTVNDYEDLTGDGAPEHRPAAVERLRRDTAHTYDPRVVDALTRVLAREPTGAWLDAVEDGNEGG
jgi:hypothetical protein